MPLPHFLIIGAMKAGTTTLYEDLRGVPGIYLPPEKEPNDLCSAAVESAQGRARYAAKFAAAPADTVIGEASTAYTMRPTYPGVAAHAVNVLGPNLRVIYMTREPVQRIVSHYRHLWGLNLEQRPLNIAVLEDETYLAYSRYDWQLEPWRLALPETAILTVPFERYVTEKSAELARICAFLRVAPPMQVSSTHRNASEGKFVPRQGTVWKRFATSSFYLYRIKPLLPTRLRDAAKRAVLAKSRPSDETLSPETEAVLRRRLAEPPRPVDDAHNRSGGTVTSGSPGHAAVAGVDRP